MIIPVMVGILLILISQWLCYYYTLTGACINITLSWRPCDSHHQHGGSITIRLSQGRVLLLHYPAGRAIIITSMEAVSAFLPWKQDSSSSPLFPRLLPRASSPSQENHRDAQGIPCQHCPSCCHTHTRLYVLCL